ncbi:unnamed protein product, partial [Pylaiella littoralis]
GYIHATSNQWKCRVFKGNGACCADAMRQKNKLHGKEARPRGFQGVSNQQTRCSRSSIVDFVCQYGKRGRVQRVNNQQLMEVRTLQGTLVRFFSTFDRTGKYTGNGLTSKRGAREIL